MPGNMRKQQDRTLTILLPRLTATTTVEAPCVEAALASKFGPYFLGTETWVETSVEGQTLSAGRLVRQTKHINRFSLEEGV